MSVRWGILTCGSISNDFVNALNSTPNAQIVACAARELKRAQDFAVNHHIPVAYGSYEELVNDKNVDIVYVSSLHRTHYEHTMLALNHGKHVLVEKPAAINSTELKAMYKLAEEKKLFLMEGVWTLFFPAFRKIVELINTGVIGEVTQVSADFTVQFPPFFDRFWKNELAGGGLMDIGIYPVSIITMLINGGTQPPIEIKASGVMQNGIDVIGTTILKYAGNKVGIANWNGLGHSPKETLIVGSKGYIKVQGPSHHPTDIFLYISTVAGSNLKNSQTETTHFHFPLPADKRIYWPYYYSLSVGFIYEITHIQETLLEKKTVSNIYPPSSSLIVMGILDEVRKQIGLIYPWEKSLL